MSSMSKHNFPPECEEAALLVLAKRRLFTRADVCPVDGWRLTMALRSGQLAESPWARNVLQIISFDDTSVLWLGLAHTPVLLTALLQHYRHTLVVMFARWAPPSTLGWYTRELLPADPRLQGSLTWASAGRPIVPTVPLG